MANILWTFFLGTMLEQKSGGFLDFGSNGANQALEMGFKILRRGFQSAADAEKQARPSSGGARPAKRATRRL
jgi:hypothetical protein